MANNMIIKVFTLAVLMGFSQGCMAANIASVNENESNTALLNAAFDNKYAKAEKALLSGADINSKDRAGRTALAWSVVNGNLKLTKLLVEKGADVNFRDKDQATLLHLALVPKIFPPRLNRNEVQKDIGLEQRYAMVDYLLKMKVDPAIADESGSVPLHMAASLPGNYNEHIKLLALLIKNIDLIGLKNKYGYTPVDLAKDKKIADYLLTITKSKH